MPALTLAGIGTLALAKEPEKSVVDVASVVPPMVSHVNVTFSFAPKQSPEATTVPPGATVVGERFRYDSNPVHVTEPPVEVVVAVGDALAGSVVVTVADGVVDSVTVSDGVADGDGVVAVGESVADAVVVPVAVEVQVADAV